MVLRPRFPRALIALGAALALAFAPSLAPAQVLDREVSAAYTAAKLGQAEVGLSIIDVDTGQVLASLNERQTFAPASNNKLLTSGVALLVLGKDFQFTTKLFFDDARLIIEGSGDPGLADPALLDRMGLSLDDFLARIVEQLRQARVAGVREVIVDDRAFDRELIHPSWPRDQLNKDYCAPVAGLNFSANCVDIYASRGPRDGAPPAWRSVPAAPWIEIVNKARTIADGPSTIGAVRDADTTRFTLTGALVTTQPPISIPMADPGLVLGRLIADRLAAASLSATAQAPAVRRATDQDRWPTARLVAQVVTDLPMVLERSNTNSNNLYAEALLKALGRAVTGQPGSWSSGAAVVRMTINERLGVDAASLVISDGSGLSRDNRVSPDLLARFLAYMARQDTADLFVNSLADTGDSRRGAALASRRLKSTLRFKTGHINNVACLSGYLTNSAGRRVAFSILVNATSQGGGTANAHAFQDSVVALADRWLAKQPAQQTTLAPGAPAPR